MEDTQEMSSGSVFSRYRSPTFSEREVKTLLNIIEKYKTIVLNKSSSAAASRAKEITWSKIAKIFNSQEFRHKRTADCLKIKWLNLKKRNAKNVSNNLVDARNVEFDDAVKQRVAMLCIAENNTSIVAEPTDSDSEFNVLEEKKQINAFHWNGNNKESPNCTDDYNENKSRHRSPTFSEREVNVLLTIIGKYKTIILKKSISASANHAKEATWVKIAEKFNSQGFRHIRSVDSLKGKWCNLKNDARKQSNNLNDARNCQFDTVRQMVAMMHEAENKTSIVDGPTASDSEFNFTEEMNDNEQTTNDSHLNGYEDSDGSIDGDNENKGLVKRSMNFSPQECSLLLQCVKPEKKIVFSKGTSASVNNLKNGAWKRITHSYNKLSPQKRATKVLRTKFTNMKKMTSKIKFKNYLKGFGKKHNKMEDSDNKIKLEPLFDCDGDHNADIDDDVHNHEGIDGMSDHGSHSNNANDPLSTVLSTDSGISSINLSENKEIVKLKQELLKYKLETAKLKRKRMQELAQYEAAEREMKTIENALRLRAARLEVVAAEMKLPPTALCPSHPALAYTAEEARAQHYMHQYHAT